MIEAVSRTCKTMADGTLRITFDVPPKGAKDAFGLFGEPDVPVVLARLTQWAAQKSVQAEMIAGDKTKGGALSKLAGQWCNSVTFFDFIRKLYDKKLGGTGGGSGDITVDEIGGMTLFSRHAILVFCEIDSRAQLDHNARAARLFNEKVRAPYMEYLRQVAA